MSTNNAPFSPAADRNKQPILEVLRGLLRPQGRALEIASGTGQHAAWFTAALPDWFWQPSDLHASGLSGIADHARQAVAANVLAPVVLDVCDGHWPSSGPEFEQPFDLIYCANMIHIAPWACCGALMRGSSRHLADDGHLVLYGPFFEAGVVPEAGNLAFDKSLRARDPAWGIRQLDDVVREAHQVGLRLLARHAMPANNLMLVWARAGS